MPKKIATLLLSIAAIVPMALPVQASTTADAIDSSSKITMDGQSNLIAHRHTKSSRRYRSKSTMDGKSNQTASRKGKLSRSEIGRRTRERIGCGRVEDACFNPRRVVR
jgi:hypothetical protein